VLRESSLWTTFEEHQQRPFPEAVVLGDSAYPLTEWLITPFPGEPGITLRPKIMQGELLNSYISYNTRVL